MPKVTIYVPDELLRAAKSHEPALNISAVCQRGLRQALGIPAGGHEDAGTIQVNFHVDGPDAARVVQLVREEMRRQGVSGGDVR